MTREIDHRDCQHGFADTEDSRTSQPSQSVMSEPVAYVDQHYGLQRTREGIDLPVGTKLYASPQPCTRCAELEALESVRLNVMQMKRIAELQAKLAAAEKDAERYRWLRVNNIKANVRFHFADRSSPYIYGCYLDESIDAAIAESKKREKA